jgi:Type II secretion system (T2SS), protein M subtype b
MSRPPSNARERRTIAWGAAVAFTALVLAYGVLPVARRWSAREDAIATARDRVARLEGLLAAGTSPAAPTGNALLIRGRTADLAGSALQAELQDLARASRVSITQLEVQADTTDPAAAGVRASLSATTDVYGLADLLARVQGHHPVLSAVELTATMNPVLRGNLLQVSLGVHAPWLAVP